jgi:hypothetical protein
MHIYYGKKDLTTRIIETAGPWALGQFVQISWI